MGQHVYWNAPLWEVLLAGSVSLALLGWLVARALRCPDVAISLSAVDPALNSQPLFFFDRIKGLRCLNDAARQALQMLPEARRQFLLDVLMDTLLESHEEARLARQQDWPEPDCVLMAMPIFKKPDGVAGVLALVITEPPLPPADLVAKEIRVGEAEAWLAPGSSLRFHCTQPMVQVKRTGVEMADNASWQEYHLNSMEAALLRRLLEHSAEPQASEMLFGVVWPDEQVDRYGLRLDQRDRLRRLVFQLRQHIEPDPRNPRYVRTVHGVGYVLYPERESSLQ